jgi:DNA modification methylase
MERLVEDYSRPGDLVCDPCCGAGTTLEAALRTGRLAVGGDVLREHAELSARRVGGMVQRPLFAGGER